MSLQAQPQQQPQQPVQVYPTNQPPSSSHHSNGSFGAVFIVLAIILVISVVACFLGRLCNKRYNNSHSNRQKPSKQHNRPQIHNLHPRDHHHHEGDIEFGDKGMPPPIIRTQQEHGHGHGHEGDIEFEGDIRMPPPIIRTKERGHGHHGHGAAGTGGPQLHHVNDTMKDFNLRPGHGEVLRAGA
ncbi:hypothetical protein AAZX31_08G276800 [Glycine max]|uniref:Uncharacterized protein n=2 Tax=Glycine subgen. Soja TaxID=1462606 RepID=I1KXF4_SOYBN|nr:uncharacterized protein LOC102668752 [Glycine max]XP_028246629.1 uncharacterized protein LOC114423919 [Glycine soja]KAG5001693.1 hypothetical protein JHK87_022765 [Glycine soja]KAG5026974.1 hypothetical protein JHK86_022888 [Glycine max]KAG5138117.1 hypothetical protein JHK82_022848 [Glycine max]KAH1053578.1 hypothetical protein GYH30_022712 [Glycine max]KAH1239132.1 hypothetical protein GmHk_08G023635 [Glycine max]|eukprot:XP_006586543.1 uncharacterized protein LOC102668752 [Glycine max]